MTEGPREAVKASNRAIKGIIGPADQVGAVKGDLDIRPLAIQKDKTEKLYSLKLNELIVPDRLSSGLLRGRRIEARDVDLVTEWRLRFSIEALGDEDGPDLRDRAHTDMERKSDEGMTWILEDGVVPLACSSFNTAIREAVQIGGVWTPPGLRRRGYGRAVVAASLLDARAAGVEMSILFTGQDNVPAQRAYEAIGFKHVGEYHILLLRDGPS